MQFNWIDLVIVIILLLFIVDAYEKTFFSEFLDFLGFLTAFFLSFALYSIPGGFLQSQFNFPRGASLAFGFISIWFLTESAFYMLAPMVFKSFFVFQKKYPTLNYFSPVPAILRGLIFIALILIITLTLPLKPVVKESIQSAVLGAELVKVAYRLEGPVKGVFGAVNQDSLTFLTVKPEDKGSINLGFTTNNFHPDANTEEVMIALVNKERLSRGVKPLIFDDKLRQLARTHSADMFQRGYFSHFTMEGKDLAQRADQAGINYSVIGENLAYAPSLELAHQGLMNSPGHRANILSVDFHKIGIGVQDGGVYGLMLTQVFSD